MTSLAFSGTPTGVLEILLNITPIEEFFLAETVRGSYRITVSELWHVNRVGFFGKRKIMLIFAMRQEDCYFCCKCQLTE